MSLNYCDRYDSIGKFMRNCIFDLEPVTFSTVLMRVEEWTDKITKCFEKRLELIENDYEVFVGHSEENKQAINRELQKHFCYNFNSIIENSLKYGKTEFPKELLLENFNKYVSELRDGFIKSLSVMPNNFSANDSRLGKCREYINDILDVFSRYLRFIEDAAVKVIAGDSWSKNLIDVSTMELGKQYTDFGLIVRFVDSFSMAFHKDIESENGVYSSCMLITEKTNKSYSDRSIGFIMGMNLENMVVIDEEDTNFLHNDATSGMGDWSVADIMDSKYMIYSRTKTAHRAIDYDRFKALVNPDEVNEIVLRKSISDAPILIQHDLDHALIYKYYTFASVLNVSVVLWNRQDHWIERIL